MRRLPLALAALLALGVTACSKKAQPEAAAPTAAAQPAAAQPQAQAQKATLNGQVLERIDADPYSYLHLKTAEGEVWAAVPKAPLEKGAQVAIQDPMTMVDFQSKSLNRKFDKIVFGTLAGTQVAGKAPAAGQNPQAPMAAGEKAQAHANLAKADVEMDVKVPKAEGEGAHTIAEIYAEKGALAGKTVLVRGKVVKYNPGIMGRNWIHLRDGSGSSADGNNDLTVTTNDETKVGDTVVAKGVLHTDKDFGAGYTYGVIVEEASLQK